MNFKSIFSFVLILVCLLNMSCATVIKAEKYQSDRPLELETSLVSEGIFRQEQKVVDPFAVHSELSATAVADKNYIAYNTWRDRQFATLGLTFLLWISSLLPHDNKSQNALFLGGVATYATSYFFKSKANSYLEDAVNDYNHGLNRGSQLKPNVPSLSLSFEF